MEPITLEPSTALTSTSVEFITLDGDSTVNSWNGLEVSRVVETGNSITIDFVMPVDESAPAAMYALIGGADLDIIRTHRTDADGNVYLTVKHVIDGVKNWEVISYPSTPSIQVVTITYYTEASMLIGDNSVSEVTKSDN